MNWFRRKSAADHQPIEPEKPASQPPTPPPFPAFGPPLMSLADMMQAIANQPPPPPALDQIVSAVAKPASDVRRIVSVSNESTCCALNRRDAVVILSFKDTAESDPMLDQSVKWLKLGIVNEHSRDVTFGLFDLDSLRNLVNRLSAAIDAEARR